MAYIAVPAEPSFNVYSVPEVLETDPVIASFINTYFQHLLSNDQALKIMIEAKPDKKNLPQVATTGSYNDLADLPTVVNNDTTEDETCLAGAKIVKAHGDEIDSIVHFLNGKVTDEQINKILNS